MNHTKFKLISLIGLALFYISGMAQRHFVHPGITYTQSDLDRMKAMVDARKEPFYSTFLELSKTIVTPGNLTEITQIKEGGHNGTIGMDGRRAHDNALMWHLTGNKQYANNAVKYLNRYLNLTNSSSRGTAPLDNGKIYMLIEAAELMRNYEGWLAADQQKFKDMLVYPGYSSNAIPANPSWLTDSLNNVTIYWNIYNFDRGRFGNQGLFAARGLLAMGVFLDNDTIYDRAYRYLLGMNHRTDDLPYPSGPVVVGALTLETDYLNTHNATYGISVPDYGYDELLKYYIYQNGQCQESCRDQGHVMAGIGNYAAIAEIAWNQGDSLYSCLNNRVLTGIEYNTRYNLSLLQSYPDQQSPWEVSGFSTNEADCTYENGVFYQAWSRSGRWFGKNIYPTDRGHVFTSGGWREQTAAHYKVRAGVDAAEMKWLQRSLDKLIADYGFENWGTSGHHYEFFGWGTLTKRLETFMAGDAGTWMNGQRVSKMPSVPCTIKAVDYDFYSENGEGHTYHNATQTKNMVYRTDGAIEIVQDDNEFAITDMVAGEWINYTVAFPAAQGDTISGITRKYNVYVNYKSAGEGAKLFASIGNGDKKGKELALANEWTERLLGTFEVENGAAVLRLYVKGTSNMLQLKDIRIEPLVLKKKSLVNLNSNNVTAKVYDGSDNDVTPNYIAALTSATDSIFTTNINLDSKKFIVYDFGESGLNIDDVTLFNDGQNQDGREQIKVLGNTENGTYQGTWIQNNASNVIRTNGTTYNPYVAVIDNSWVTSNGTVGHYTAGSLGKYRYLGVYNWSATCRISEIQLYVNEWIVNDVEDVESLAEWDNTDDTGSGIDTQKADNIVNILILNNEVTVKGASKIVAFTIDGKQPTSSIGEKIILPKSGFYILKIDKGAAVFNRKILIQ